MVLALQAFWCVTALELLIWLLPTLYARRVAAAMLFPLIPVTAILVAIIYPAFPTVLLAVAGLYRAANALRLIRGRTDAHYLRRATLTTSLWIVSAQAGLMTCWLLADRLGWTMQAVGWIVAAVDLLAAAVFLASTVRHAVTTRPPVAPGAVNLASLPTLTVAIPARNETDDLQSCLESLLASDYPKLEILVLDDCSQNKRTPEIIRSYAHAGVRFLQGEAPADNWLAKNFAYQQLFEASSGELVLFCGVDVRLAPDSLSRLVTALQHKHKSMISVIPRNTVPPLAARHSTTLIQSMRYVWELALPRRIFRRPPVLSTCWLVRRELVSSAGGFAAVSRSIVPESYFARLAAVSDGYSFMQGGSVLGIVSNKGLGEQRSTAVRVQYPRVHRRIELVLFLSVAECAAVLAPYFMLLQALLGGGERLTLLSSCASVVLLTAAYALVVVLAYRRFLLRSVVALPFAALVDIVLLNYSMIRYEFFSVIWKDRNVCIPVMRVTDEASLTRSASVPASADSVR